MKHEIPEDNNKEDIPEDNNKEDNLISTGEVFFMDFYKIL